jgi:hypothetical protein
MKIQLVSEININGEPNTWMAFLDKDEVKHCKICKKNFENEDWAYFCMQCKEGYCYNCRKGYIENKHNTSCLHDGFSEKKLVRFGDKR